MSTISKRHPNAVHFSPREQSRQFPSASRLPFVIVNHSSKISLLCRRHRRLHSTLVTFSIAKKSRCDNLNPESGRHRIPRPIDKRLEEPSCLRYRKALGAGGVHQTRTDQNRCLQGVYCHKIRAPQVLEITPEPRPLLKITGHAFHTAGFLDQYSAPSSTSK